MIGLVEAKSPGAESPDKLVVSESCLGADPCLERFQEEIRRGG